MDRYASFHRRMTDRRMTELGAGSAFRQKQRAIIACCNGHSEESMVFAKRLREGVVRGDITCSVRIWTRPHVTEGRRYRMGDGEIEIESVTPIGFPDITPELARESGFLGVLDLLKVAKHGMGNNIYLIRFRYIPPHQKRRDGSKRK